jgi:hypothetical protein
MTAHTMTLNADGTQEETIEFTSMVNPNIFQDSLDDGCDRPTPVGEF